MNERQHAGWGWLLVALLGPTVYLLSPPFLLSLTYVLGIEWGLIRDTLYLPIVVTGSAFPRVIPWYEGYCQFVISLLGLPVP